MTGKASICKFVVTGALGAVSVALMLTPLGKIPGFAGTSPTIVNESVIIGAALEGPVVGMGVGTIFGVSALVRAAVAPQEPSTSSS
jgi:uncharacterized membrane protein